MSDEYVFTLAKILDDYWGVMCTDGNTTEARRASLALACGHGNMIMDHCAGCDCGDEPYADAAPMIALFPQDDD